MTSDRMTLDPVAELLRRALELDAASLSDADKSLRVLPPEIRPVAPGLRMVGRAVTADAGDDLMSVLAGLAQGGPGDVLVVATSGAGNAVAGELFATEARRRGLAGMVIDGFCRDLATLRGLGLPIFARGATPRAAGANARPIVQQAVHIGGIAVDPGDILIGDDDGIVVATIAELAAAVDAAEAIQVREGALRSSMLDGVSLFDRINFQDHAARVERGEPSALAFD